MWVAFMEPIALGMPHQLLKLNIITCMLSPTCQEIIEYDVDRHDHFSKDKNHCRLSNRTIGYK